MDFQWINNFGTPCSLRLDGNRRLRSDFQFSSSHSSPTCPTTFQGNISYGLNGRTIFYCYFDLFLSNCHVSTRILEHLFILSGNIFKYLNKFIAIKLYSPSDWLDRFSLSQTWLHLKYIKQKCFRKPISIVKNAKAFLDCDTNSTCRSVDVETWYIYKYMEPWACTGVG